MPKFRYKAKDINNKVMSGVFFAKDEDDLREIISNLNYYLIGCKKIPESSQMFSFLEKIKMDDLTLFCRQFAIMLNSGITLIDCVKILKENTINKKLQGILEVAEKDLLEGKMISTTFAKYPKTFPEFFRNMIEIGELSGKLDTIFNRLADYYDRDYKTKKKVKSALSYPIMLIVLANAVLAILALWILPKFKTLFDSFNTELPGISVAVLKVSDFIKAHWSEVLIGVVILLVINMFLKKIPSYKRKLDELKIRLPILKTINLANATSRFTRGFVTLIKSGIPVLDALSSMGKLIGNTYIEEKMRVACAEVKRGQPISKSLGTINIFPPMLIQMIAVGEETGQLQEVLERVADYYDDQVDFAIKKMTSAIEPVMILFVAGIVVCVLLAILLPMMGLMGAIESSAQV